LVALLRGGRLAALLLMRLLLLPLLLLLLMLLLLLLLLASNAGGGRCGAALARVRATRARVATEVGARIRLDASHHQEQA
jgi:hypothetical protein